MPDHHFKKVNLMKKTEISSNFHSNTFLRWNTYSDCFTPIISSKGTFCIYIIGINHGIRNYSIKVVILIIFHVSKNGRFGSIGKHNGLFSEFVCVLFVQKRYKNAWEISKPIGYSLDEKYIPLVGAKHANYINSEVSVNLPFFYSFLFYFPISCLNEL